MPTVPKATRQVDLAPLPDVRLTAAATPESEGAGVAEAQGQIGEALAGVGHKTTALGEELLAKERQNANAVTAIKNNSDLTGWVDKRLNDPETGVLQTRGENALGLPEKVSTEYNDYADGLAAKLSNPQQRLAFDRIRAERGLVLANRVMEHTTSQIQQVRADTAESSVKNSQSFAIANADNPRVIGQELATQATTITTIGKQLGMSPESIKARLDASFSATHVGVIENLLAQEKTKAAQVYFEETKSQINGEQIARIEKALHEGTTRKEGQTQADAILAAGGTLTEQREKARQIDDADVRDQVMQRLEHEHDVAKQVDREHTEAAMTAAVNILDKTPDVGKIPPTTWVSFSEGERSALRSYADRLSKGDPVETDWPTYYGLMSKAGTDPTTFATENLLGYRGKLGNGEFKQLTDLQLSIRNKDAASADKQLAGFRTHEQIVNDSLGQYGINPNEPDKTKKTAQEPAIAELRRMVDVQVQAQENLTGKKPTNEDIQSIVDKILSTPTTKKGSWWGLLPWPTGVNFFDQPAGKRLIESTINDVPPVDRTQIEAALKKAGRPVTDVTILDLYIRTQSRLQK